VVDQVETCKAEHANARIWINVPGFVALGAAGQCNVELVEVGLLRWSGHDPKLRRMGCPFPRVVCEWWGLFCRAFHGTRGLCF
jgi:hypothetical protein